MRGVLAGVLIFVFLAFPSVQKYCIQVATHRSLDPALEDFEKIKDFPEARIELREGVYLLRAGAEERARDLVLILRRVRRFFPDAFIKKCEINPAYVVHPKVEKAEIGPEPQDVQKEEEEEIVEPKPEPENKEVEELKEEIKKLREEISALKSERVVPYKFEKFLFSVGLFVGGLFLFTWFLIALLYRKVGVVNIKEAELMNDVFNLIKVLNLLARGYTVKMENGKIMVYDKDKDRWKEAE